MTIEGTRSVAGREVHAQAPAQAHNVPGTGNGAVPSGLDRIVVQDVRPSTPHGYPAKALVGEAIPVSANIFRDGHDVLAAKAVLRRDGEIVGSCPLTALGNDEWSGTLFASDLGAHELVVQAWTDRYVLAGDRTSDLTSSAPVPLWVERKREIGRAHV